MKEWIAAFAFIVISFITGLSIAFNLCAMLGDEKKFFTSRKMSVLIYVMGVTFAIIFTILSYYGVCMLQRIL